MLHSQSLSVSRNFTVVELCAVSYPEPPESKNAVRRAGRAISEGTASDEDYAVVDRWRSAHGYVINTFQIWLKRHIEKHDISVEFAQRLKRRNTVVDKLLRRNSQGQPLIADVSAMHDFAGCRMIFKNIEDLQKFRGYILSAGVTKNVKHELRHAKDKYDYIEHPKASGYRGIHDVYKHLPRGAERREDRKPWDGLLVEVQYRTRAQHAWATAVEISDLIDGERTKFEMDQSKRGLFFSIASELIARRHEHLTRAFVDKSTDDLEADLQALEQELGILRRLSLLKKFESENQLKRHNVLNIFRKPDGSLGLDVKGFNSAGPAIERATYLEKNPEESINAVYVRSDNPNQLRSAYRNYFSDPVDFVDILKEEGGVDAQV